MKKIIAFVLLVVLVAGIVPPAFAATNKYTFGKKALSSPFSFELDSRWSTYTTEDMSYFLQSD